MVPWCETNIVFFKDCQSYTHHMYHWKDGLDAYLSIVTDLLCRWHTACSPPPLLYKSVWRMLSLSYQETDQHLQHQPWQAQHSGASDNVQFLEIVYIEHYQYLWNLLEVDACVPGVALSELALLCCVGRPGLLFLLLLSTLIIWPCLELPGYIHCRPVGMSQILDMSPNPIRIQFMQYRFSLGEDSLMWLLDTATWSRWRHTVCTSYLDHLVFQPVFN